MNTIFSQYKEFINSNYTELKDEVELIVRRKQLSSIMNDTKWLKLQTAILSTAEFKPAYIVQLLTDEIEYSPVFGRTPTYLGDWELIFENWEYAPPPFFNIKWMAIQPLLEIHKGRLVNPEIIDKSDILLNILHKYHIPFEKEHEHTFIIYGYK
ncbi:MAG: DUF6678 family protein [Phocaeicola sp.]|nr:hypothetical protein [Phocaeicola sp.]MDD7448475.1 hypothetical protein [Prevotellaceae bacterium]MDY5939852.1 DUF6678 family protein [Phocaeicola sp.]